MGGVRFHGFSLSPSAPFGRRRGKSSSCPPAPYIDLLDWFDLILLIYSLTQSPSDSS